MIDVQKLSEIATHKKGCDPKMLLLKLFLQVPQEQIF